MAKFKKRPVIIDAVQLIEGEPWPAGVQRYPGTKEDMFVTTIQGQRVPVKYGEWIIAEPDGIHFYPCDPVVFAQRHERCEPVGKPQPGYMLET